MHKFVPLNLNLQFFADEPPVQPVEQQQQQQVNEPPTFSLEDFQKYANENEEVAQWLQSQKDSFFSKSLETWKANNLQTIIDKKIEELNPNETPEQKQVRELRQQLQSMEQQSKMKEIRGDAIAYASEQNIPTSLVERFLGDDIEATKANLDGLKGTLESYIQAEVNNRLKGMGTPPPGTSNEEKAQTMAERIAKAKQDATQKVNNIDPWKQYQ